MIFGIPFPDSTVEIQKKRCIYNVEKFGKQYVIRLLNSSAQSLSDTEDFLTFGIDIPTKEQLNLMKSFNKKEKDGEDAEEEMNNEETDDLV